MANHARILLLVGKEKEYNAYISSFVSLIVSCAYKPKGVIVGGARPSVYQFPCHLCSRSRPAGTLSIGVKPFHGANTTQWLRFCAPLPPSSSSSSSASAPQGQEEQQLSCFESLGCRRQRRPRTSTSQAQRCFTTHRWPWYFH